MDVGCGAGPLTRTLVDVGFEVTGVDASAELLELARANVPSVQFVHGSAYDVPIRGYDAVAAVGEALTYHPEDAYADNLVCGFFERVGTTLPPGGVLIFECDWIGRAFLGRPDLETRRGLGRTGRDNRESS